MQLFFKNPEDFISSLGKSGLNPVFQMQVKWHLPNKFQPIWGLMVVITMLFLKPMIPEWVGSLYKLTNPAFCMCMFSGIGMSQLLSPFLISAI